MSHSVLFAIVLAAGTSSRFGTLKQLQEYRGRSFVRRAVDLAEATCGERSVLVAGHDWKAVFDACKPVRGFVVVNSAYREGMASSIASGVEAVRHAADAVLLLLADQPLVTAEHLHALVSAWGGDPERLVATAFADTVGPPALLPSSNFDRLTALQGDRGAHTVLMEAGAKLRTVAFAPAAIDVDRPEDVVRLP
jgi:molybdenum cofactor cytidylyltransferase